MIHLNLNPREKMAVAAAGIVVAAFLVLQFVITPFFENRQALRDQLEAKSRSLAEMRELQDEYQRLQHSLSISMEQFENRPESFTLFSFLDQLAGRTGIKAHVSYMKPSSTINEETGVSLSRVEMELQAISLKDLTKYLYHVETSENMVIVKRLSIARKGKSEGLIDAVLQVETVET
jgi:general secretion pathway protein M